MSGLSILKLNQGDSLKNYRVVFRDGSYAIVKAKCFYISDVLTYCFSTEDLEEMDKKVRMNKIPRIVYEVAKREVFSICEEGSADFFAKPARTRATQAPKKQTSRKKRG